MSKLSLYKKSFMTLSSKKENTKAKKSLMHLIQAQAEWIHHKLLKIWQELTNFHLMVLCNMLSQHGSWVQWKTLGLTGVSIHYIFNRILTDALRKILNWGIRTSFLDKRLTYNVTTHITNKIKDPQSLHH